MYKKYDITIIDNFKIYNKIDRTGLHHEVGTWFYNNRRTMPYYKNHIIIYYKVLNINIKLCELILFGDKNQLIDLINKDNLYYYLRNYIEEIVHSKIYYYISKFNNFINRLTDKIKIKRKFNKPIEFGYE